MSERESANRMAMGSKKYKEKIHRESKFADDNKNLPFKFSKPRKYKPLNTRFVCEKCSHEAAVSEETIVVICSVCKHLNRLKRKK